MPRQRRSLGLVNWVVPNDKLEEETARIARRLADGPTGAYAQAKRLMNQSFATPMETQMEEELAGFLALRAWRGPQGRRHRFRRKTQTGVPRAR